MVIENKATNTLVEATADVNIGGTITHPTVTGRVDVDRGEWDFNGASNTLTTTQGFVNSGIVRGNARMISSLTNNSQGQVSVGAGQRLQITWTQAAGIGNITLQAAALQ